MKHVKHRSLHRSYRRHPIFPHIPTVTPTYPLNPAQTADLAKRFTYHAPKPGQPERYTALRETALKLATLVVEQTPNGREQALALTKIEEAVMWANSAIARGEGDRTPAEKALLGFAAQSQQ